MGAGASTELTKDQLEEKYANVKHHLYPQQQSTIETLFRLSDNPAEILETVNNLLNDPEVPNMDFETMPDLTNEHKSLMAAHLTPELFGKLKAEGATSKGYTISRAIQTGLMTPHLGVGVTAGDEESWEKFKGIYYPVIKGWHKYDPETQTHTSDLDASKITMTDDQVAGVYCPSAPFFGGGVREDSLLCLCMYVRNSVLCCPSPSARAGSLLFINFYKIIHVTSRGISQENFSASCV